MNIFLTFTTFQQESLFVNWQNICGSQFYACGFAFYTHFTRVLRQTFRRSEWKSTRITPSFSDSTWSPADDVISAFPSKSMQSFYAFYELFFFPAISNVHLLFYVNVIQWVLVCVYLFYVYYLAHTFVYILFEYEGLEDACGLSKAAWLLLQLAASSHLILYICHLFFQVGKSHKALHILLVVYSN